MATELTNEKNSVWYVFRYTRTRYTRTWFGNSSDI